MRCLPASACSVRPPPRQICVARAGFFQGLFGGAKGAEGGAIKGKREAAKKELLSVIEGLDRGARATDDDKARVESAASALEKLAAPGSPLGTLLTGRWLLLYTTSASILGLSRPPLLRPFGPIVQEIDAEALTARNVEGAPFYNQVSAELEPLDSNTVAVQFKEFKIFGVIPVKAPPTARGKLQITYLDEELRVSRGDKGNLFVLSRLKE